MLVAGGRGAGAALPPPGLARGLRRGARARARARGPRTKRRRLLRGYDMKVLDTMTYYREFEHAVIMIARFFREAGSMPVLRVRKGAGETWCGGERGSTAH